MRIWSLFICLASLGSIHFFGCVSLDQHRREVTRAKYVQRQRDERRCHYREREVRRYRDLLRRLRARLRSYRSAQEQAAAHEKPLPEPARRVAQRHGHARRPAASARRPRTARGGMVGRELTGWGPPSGGLGFPSRSRSVVRLGTVSLRGNADRSLVRRLLYRQLPQYRSCYLRAFGVASKQRSGQVRLGFTVDRQGLVRAPRILMSTLSDVGFTRCLVSSTARFRFVKPNGPSLGVRATLLFSPVKRQRPFGSPIR